MWKPYVYMEAFKGGKNTDSIKNNLTDEFLVFWEENIFLRVREKKM